MRKGRIPARAALVAVVLALMVFAAATRFGLDLVGPPLVDWMEQLHESTGWFEGARAADR